MLSLRSNNLRRSEAPVLMTNMVFFTYCVEFASLISEVLVYIPPRSKQGGDFQDNLSVSFEFHF